ncbi:MAG TPA: thioredoxin domain-containing protein [Pyrinomonadaceae bacterium]|jgi:protein-disulfide isomerase
MNNNKNSNFLFILTGLFLLVAIISGCGNSSTGNNARSGSNSNKANNASNTPNYASAPPGANPAHFKGNQAARVVIEEFADYQCPTCGSMHPIVQQIQAAYGDRIKIIFRNMPLTQVHPKAYDAAVAAEAAGLQGKFWEMQNQLFTNQQFWTTAADHRKTFEEYAQKIGLDVQKFSADMAGMEAKSRVDADLQRARALQVGSTPTFYINGRQLAFEDTVEFNRFRQVIDAELQKTQAATQTAPPASNAATPANANTSAGNANQAGTNK